MMVQAAAIPNSSAKMIQLAVTTVAGEMSVSWMKQAGSQSLPSLGVKWFIHEIGCDTFQRDQLAQRRSGLLLVAALGNS
jgi:hypothetical protein